MPCKHEGVCDLRNKLCSISCQVVPNYLKHISLLKTGAIDVSNHILKKLIPKLKDLKPDE